MNIEKPYETVAEVDRHTSYCQQLTYYKSEHKVCDCNCHGSTVPNAEKNPREVEGKPLTGAYAGVA